MKNVALKQELEFNMLMRCLYPIDDLTEKVVKSTEMVKDIMINCNDYLTRPDCDPEVLRIINTITDSLMMHNKIQLMLLDQPIPE